MLTEVLISFKLITISGILCYGLSSVKGACITCGTCKCIGLRKEALASLEILETKAFDIGCKEPRLAESIVSMAMECAEKTTMVVLACLISKRAVVESGTKPTSDIISEGEVRPKDVKHLCDNCERIFGAGSKVQY